jgi:hypothetical protein
MEEAARQAVGDGRSRSWLASETKPDTGRLNRKRMTLYGIRRRGDGHQTQKKGRPKTASTQQIAILLYKISFSFLIIRIRVLNYIINIIDALKPV